MALANNAELFIFLNHILLDVVPIYANYSLNSNALNYIL